MPASAELDEFGLEVEHEHHSLIGSGGAAPPSPARRSALSISSGGPSSSKSRPPTARLVFGRPPLGILKWALLVLACALVAFHQLGRESAETTYVESNLLEDVEECVDDPEFTLMVKKEKSCATYVANVGRESLLAARCDQPVGIADEGEFQKLLKHFCRKSCGYCGVKDDEEGVSQAEIDKEVEEIAEEIEEKEEREKGEAEEHEKQSHIQVHIESNDDDDNEHGEEEDGDIDNGEEEDGVVGNGEEGDGDIDDGKGTASDSDADEAKEEDAIADGEKYNVLDDDGQRGEDEDDDDNVGDQPGETDDSNDREGSAADSNSGDSISGLFTLQRLKDTREAALILIDTLEEYYNGKETAERMMFQSWLSPWEFDAPKGQARERVDKIVDTMLRALITDDQDQFIIGTIGSSVAAGHDNCRYDSYESQLQRTLGPVWEAAGMELVCQNAGEGGGCGDDFKNQAYCIKQNVSPNIDIAHYTWTYFEVGDEERYNIRESLIRWTQMLPHQPPVHVFNVLYRPPVHDKQEYEIAEHYAKYGYNIFFMREGHKLGGYDYDAANEKGIDHYAAQFVGDGYHNITRYGTNEENPDRRESLGVVMRNWHPGPLAFEFVSDTFAYIYTRAMLTALDLIEEQIAAKKDPRETWSASKRKILSKRSLPEPKFCDPMYCVVDEAPGCLNYEKPTFGFWGAKVEDADDSLNPHKGELQKWDVWHQESDFWHMVGKMDQVVFQDRDDKEICQHLDQCGGISATSSDNGSVVFRLPKMEVGLVAICGCCGKEVAFDMFKNNTFLEIKYNGAVLDREKWDLFPTKKCVRLLQKFPTEGQAAMTPTGHAYLSVKALEGLSEPVRISHVITL